MLTGIAIGEDLHVSPTRTDEAALVERAKRDPEAFGLLYDRYVAQVYAFAYTRLRNKPDAEALTAEVFFRALREIPHYTNRGRPFADWLARPVGRACRAPSRKK